MSMFRPKPLCSWSQLLNCEELVLALLLLIRNPWYHPQLCQWIANMLNCPLAETVLDTYIYEARSRAAIYLRSLYLTREGSNSFLVDLGVSTCCSNERKASCFLLIYLSLRLFSLTTSSDFSDLLCNSLLRFWSGAWCNNSLRLLSELQLAAYISYQLSVLAKVHFAAQAWCSIPNIALIQHPE